MLYFTAPLRAFGLIRPGEGPTGFHIRTGHGPARKPLSNFVEQLRQGVV